MVDFPSDPSLSLDAVSGFSQTGGFEDIFRLTTPPALVSATGEFALAFEGDTGGSYFAVTEENLKPSSEAKENVIQNVLNGLASIPPITLTYDVSIPVNTPAPFIEDNDFAFDLGQIVFGSLAAFTVVALAPVSLTGLALFGLASAAAFVTSEVVELVEYQSEIPSGYSNAYSIFSLGYDNVVGRMAAPDYWNHFVDNNVKDVLVAATYGVAALKALRSISLKLPF